MPSATRSSFARNGVFDQAAQERDRHSGPGLSARGAVATAAGDVEPVPVDQGPDRIERSGELGGRHGFAAGIRAEAGQREEVPVRPPGLCHGSPDEPPVPGRGGLCPLRLDIDRVGVPGRARGEAEPQVGRVPVRRVRVEDPHQVGSRGGDEQQVVGVREFRSQPFVPGRVPLLRRRGERPVLVVVQHRPRARRKLRAGHRAGEPVVVGERRGPQRAADRGRRARRADQERPAVAEQFPHLAAVQARPGERADRRRGDDPVRPRRLPGRPGNGPPENGRP